jgi:hypothetical protein
MVILYTRVRVRVFIHRDNQAIRVHSKVNVRFNANQNAQKFIKSKFYQNRNGRPRYKLSGNSGEEASVARRKHNR